MLNPRLAERYAKSLIDLSIERGELETVNNDMLFLQSVAGMSREFVVILKSPVIPADKKVKIVEAVTSGKISILTLTFIKLLIRKGRESFLPEVVSAFIKQYNSFKDIHIVTLTTASPVSEELKQSIADKLKSVTPMKHIELRIEVKEGIIGGFILETGDLLIDASIAFDLNNIKKQFQNNDFIYKLR